MRFSGGIAPVRALQFTELLRHLLGRRPLHSQLLTGHCPPEAVRIACEALQDAPSSPTFCASTRVGLVKTEHRITPASELANRLVHAPRATAVRRGPLSHLQQG
jgi:hypothetical protein